jgi:hypothetical protein
MEVLADFRRDLAIRHLVGSLNGEDVYPELVSLQTLLQLALGLTRTKQQNRFGVTNRRNHLSVVIVEMARKLFLVTVIGRCLLSIVSRRTDARKTARLFLNVGFDLVGSKYLSIHSVISDCVLNAIMLPCGHKAIEGY